MIDQARTIVVALGGNALQKKGEASSSAQQRVADQTVRQLLPLIQAGHRLAVVHGNGPQVGNIVLQQEALNTPEVPTMPLEDSGAMSQGLIGFWLQQAFHDAFEVQGINKAAVSIITQTVVDRDDPAFSNPTKPIGPFYSQEEADRVAAERGYNVKEDAGRGWRRVVASPRPQRIVEAETIRQLVESGTLVVSTGGGGIPVSQADDGTLSGVEAVIDKDFGAALLADLLDADTLMILTAVDAVKINYGLENEQSLGYVTADELSRYIDQGHFAAGSMLPKVEAAREFVGKSPGRRAIITSLDSASEALEGRAGTTITNDVG